VWSSERRGPAALLALLLAACAPSYRQFDLRDQPLSCDEANRLAWRTLTAMRFRVTALEPAAPGRRGVIGAERTTADGTRTVTVAIECEPGGVTLRASEGRGWSQQAAVKRAFHHTFLNVRANREREAAADARLLAGTAPTSEQRGDLRVLVHPMRGQASRLDFPFDLEDAGVVPVHVEITNLSGRGYALAADEVRLVRRDRSRATALTAAETAARIAAAGLAATEQSTAVVERRQLATEEEVPPGTRRAGYLYFPLGEYVGARLTFVDQTTGELEGVRIDFLAADPPADMPSSP
jgi:hypothetical protein